MGILCTKIFIKFSLCFYLLCRGKSGDCRNLVYELNIQGTSFTAKSEFQVMNTDHGFWLKSGLKKIVFTQNMGLDLNLASYKKMLTPNNPLPRFPPYPIRDTRTFFCPPRFVLCLSISDVWEEEKNIYFRFLCGHI